MLPRVEQLQDNSRFKYSLWAVMAFATLSVLLYSEFPLLRQTEERAHLHALRWLLIPHILAGTFALLAAPAQFSSHLRARHLRLHKNLGRWYAACVLLAAPLAVVSTFYGQYPHPFYFRIAIAIQAGCWAGTTIVGVAAVLNRRLKQHQQWMMRSYAVTFSFVLTRVLQPIPAWNRLGRMGFAGAIVCITLLALLTPLIARRFQCTNSLKTS